MLCRTLISAVALAAFLLFALPAAAGDAMSAREGDREIGAATAPIVMIEYHSLDCPYCALFHAETFPALKRDYIDTGLVRFVYRDYPLSWAALAAAILSHCAPPERYFAVHAALLESQEHWSRAQPSVPAVAEIGEALGIAKADFDACLEARDWERQIFHSQKYARDILGVTSTPTFFINGEKLVGNIPFERLAAGLDDMLNEIQRESPNFTELKVHKTLSP
jgi:protein-disulfide isomerase